MDITKDNFKEKLPFITSCIKDCNFASVDCEFTGLRNGAHNVNFYDNMEERYFKLKENSDGFLVIQLGLSTFQWCAEQDKYLCQSFNFYVFPFSASHPQATDRIFSCQSSSIDFLIKQGFDFNTTFKKGIPYLRLEEEHFLRRTNEERQIEKQANISSPAPSPAKQITSVTDPVVLSLVNDLKEKIKTWLKDSKDEEMVVEQFCNAYVRRVLYETLPVEFPDQILIETRRDTSNNNTPKIVILRGGSDEMKQKQFDLQKKRSQDEIEQTTGLSKIFHLLMQHKKCIVGHNMMLDMIFIFRQFIADLPHTLDEFKSAMAAHFPHIVDTKLMASKTPFKEFISKNALDDLNQALKARPFGHPCLDMPGKYVSFNKDSSYLHEAGYDSFVTGNAFLSMFQYLSKIVHPSHEKHIFTQESDVIKPYLNKIYIHRLHDIPYVNLGGQDIHPQREDIFHVEFPNVWKGADLRQLFAPVGGVNLSWINDNECFVRVFNRAEIKNVSNLMKPEDSRQFHYKIRSYEQYVKDKMEFGINCGFKRPYDIEPTAPVAHPVPYKKSRFTWVKSSNNQTTATTTQSETVVASSTVDNGLHDKNPSRSPTNDESRKRKSPPDNDDDVISSTTSPTVVNMTSSSTKLSSEAENVVSSTTVPQFEVPAWD